LLLIELRLPALFVLKLSLVTADAIRRGGDRRGRYRARDRASGRNGR